MKAILFLPIVFAIVIGCCCASTPTTNSSFPQSGKSTPIPYHTSIPRSTSTNSPSSSYDSLLGNIYSGVKVYYGDNKAFGFEILGGVDNCSYFPSNQGLRVQYPDGHEEWKDRWAMVSSGNLYVRADDPAIDSMEWYVYKCP